VGSAYPATRALALAMAVLVGWPWPLALPAVQASRDARAIATHPQLGSETHHLERDVLSERRNQTDCPDLLIVFEEEEREDDGAPAAPAIATAWTSSLADPLTTATSPWLTPIRTGTLSDTYRFHLRC